MSQAEPERSDDGGSASEKFWNLRLYIAGDSPKSRAAVSNLKKLCDQYLAGRHTIEIIDLLKNPALAKAHQIVAIPTLIRELPEPIKRVIGDLSDANKALVTLDVTSSTFKPG
jgi:circadian clock protein KaiB